MFVILDFGSQYTHLIKASLGKIGFDSAILPGDAQTRGYLDEKIEGLILSGGASSVYDGKIKFDKSWLELGIPILGICYGHQLLASSTGGKVKKANFEFGKVTLKVTGKNILLKGLPKKFFVWMSHHDSVNKLPKNFSVSATSDYSNCAVFQNVKRNMYGLQFHPEVTNTEFGHKILENFCLNVCKVNPGKPWNPDDFIKSKIIEIRKLVGKGKIIFGLSGGVDSLTMSALLRKALPSKQLKAVYIDTGLMPDETVLEVTDFCKKMGIPLKVLKSKNNFFKCLVGIEHPTNKSIAIGKEFIDEFEKYAKSFGAIYFAQGTIWSDVVESGVTKFSSRIKPHHNVGGLPKKLNFKLIEPLRELFKNQVREVAKELGLPSWAVQKKVFPGPGFAIRVQGEVTSEKVALVRKATKIIEEVINNSKIRNKIWMAFAILIDVPSLGVKGDEHVENKHAIVVRVVESENSMTANFSRVVMPYLPEISKRITDELDMGRVVYDITDKPPATIEWQ